MHVNGRPSDHRVAPCSSPVHCQVGIQPGASGGWASNITEGSLILYSISSSSLLSPYSLCLPAPAPPTITPPSPSVSGRSLVALEKLLADSSQHLLSKTLTMRFLVPVITLSLYAAIASASPLPQPPLANPSKVYIKSLSYTSGRYLADSVSFPFSQNSSIVTLSPLLLCRIRRTWPIPAGESYKNCHPYQRQTPLPSALHIHLV